MTAAEILVIFLSVTLAVLLVLSIALVIILIVIAQKIKHVAETAERTVTNVEGIMSALHKAAAPAVISRFVLDQIGRFTRGNGKKEEK